ncbi:MAG: response regulator [Candidatus Aminicenantes bacterium]
MLNNHKILVVEDENIVAMDIQFTLKSLGYDVCGVVASGEESVKKAFMMQPDLVLMDIKLRGNIDGLCAAKQIQARLNIPVIYLTAYGDENTLSTIDRTKPYDYIHKPFQEKELQSTIERNLHNPQQNCHRYN